MSVVISDDLVLAAQNGTTLPLSHARIMYQNFVRSGTVTATTQAAGLPAVAVKTYTTYEKWQPTAIPATITADFGGAKEIDYILIAAHNLGSASAAIVAETSPDGTTWTAVGPDRIPSDDSAIAFLFDEISVGYIRVRITSATGDVKIGVLMSGKALAMQRPIYGGHSPINLSRNTVVKPNLSVGGEWIGASVIRGNIETSYNWENLGAGWYRDNFDPFVKAARSQPFGIAWRPSSYPKEVAYGWASGDIKPSNMGTRDYMQVNINVIGYAVGDL